MTRPTDPQRRAYLSLEGEAIRHRPAATYRLTAPCGRALAHVTRQGAAFLSLGAESPAAVLANHSRRRFVCREVPAGRVGNVAKPIGPSRDTEKRS